MTFSTLLEWWVFWLFSIVGGGLIALAKHLKRENERKMKDDDEKHEEIDTKMSCFGIALLELLRYRLRSNCDSLMYEECATHDELEDLEHLYNAYVALGGNGTLKVRYEECLRLPICEKPRRRTERTFYND